MEWLTKEAARRPEDLTKYNWQFQPHYLDWEFIFDWSKDFYERCHDETLEHLKSMEFAGGQHIMISRVIRNVLTSKAKCEYFNL